MRKPQKVTRRKGTAFMRGDASEAKRKTTSQRLRDAHDRAAADNNAICQLHTNLENTLRFLDRAAEALRALGLRRNAEHYEKYVTAVRETGKQLAYPHVDDIIEVDGKNFVKVRRNGMLFIEQEQEIPF